jgi:hypothetical protein
MHGMVMGLPALALEIGFLVIFATPVWLAAKMVGAAQATMLRSILALTLGMIGAWLCLFLTGPLALILAPLAFLLSFRFLLGTTFLGAILLALLAAVGYGLMIHFLGGGLWHGPHAGILRA